MHDIASEWQRIEAWHAANVPQDNPYLLRLGSGASEEEIEAFEAQIGFRLPDDLRTSFSLHNGTTNESFLLHFGEYLSLEQILKLHAMYSQWQTKENWGLGEDYKVEFADDPIKPIWWNSLRLPLTDNSGDGVMMDFDPAPAGMWGQIIEFDHEVGPREVLGSSFGEWLAKVADDLENGEYVYFKEEETVAPKDSQF